VGRILKIAEVFRLACERNLKGIVTKHRGSTHGDGARGLKIRNPNYTQAVGRRERFPATF